ncbi:MAG: thiolase family protein [Bacteriovoracaceae bacterium]
MTNGQKKVYLVAGKRTVFGKFGGSLKNITPVDLSVMCSQDLFKSSGIDCKTIEHVILGNVVPSSTDTMYGARHLGLKLGMPIEVPAYNVNRLCGSGIEAIMGAARLIKLNEASAVLVSGTENMSMVPHLVYGSRFGTKYGPLKTVDMLGDALSDQYAKISMGETAENLGVKYSISREACDEYAYNSHMKAAKAYAQNYLQGELTTINNGKEEIKEDEHLRKDISLAEMSKLKTSFKKDGVVTPATASGIVDGAASVIVASEDYVKKHGLTALAEIVDGFVIGVEPTCMGIGPAPAIQKLLDRNNLSMDQIDLVEINEAFAAQTIACAKELKLDMSRLNIWGGAIALGHPLGASGVRIAMTLARQLKTNNLKTGIASACIGGGQGISLLLKAV